LLAAARLCLRNELWGKARSYLETVVAIRPTPEAYQEYGRLLTRLGEDDAAAEAWRAGLSLVADPGRPAIPHLSARWAGARPLLPLAGEVGSGPAAGALQPARERLPLLPVGPGEILRQLEDAETAGVRAHVVLGFAQRGEIRRLHLGEELVELLED